MPAVLILAVIIATCSGGAPTYLKDGAKAQKNNSSANALPQVSVSFNEDYLPKAHTYLNSPNIYVVSQSKGQNEAKQYRYALLSGPTATTDSKKACTEATYSEFFTLDKPITTVAPLPEGDHLLCARGKSAAGIVQKEDEATTFAWKIDPNAPDKPPEEEPPADEPADPPITIVINPPPSVPPIVLPPTPNPDPDPDPDPDPAPVPMPTDPTPDPMAKMQIRKHNNSGTLTHAFSHGEETVVPYYIHNTGDADLTWSLSLDAQDAGWLKMTYSGETKIGNAITFSGTLAANSASTPLGVSLALDSNKRVDSKYLAVKEENGNRVETDEYVAKLVFKNENTGATEETSASVYLWIPRLKLKRDTPARKNMWELPIQNGDHDWKEMIIEKQGKGNLSWQNVKTDYNRFDVQFSNPPNGGYFRVKLRRKSRDGKNESPSIGDHTHMGVISNGGSVYMNQPEPGLRWLYVCVVDITNVNSSSECPKHDSLPPHH